MNIDLELMKVISARVSKMIEAEYPEANLDTRVYAMIGSICAELGFASTSEDDMRTRVDVVMKTMEKHRELFIASARDTWAVMGKRSRTKGGAH